MRRILVLSFYYPPDLCAGSFRTEAFIKALLPLAEERGIEIDVVTTMPNRYHHFRASAQANEQLGLLNILRIPLPNHQSGVKDQAKAFAKYFFQARKITKNKHYDLVYATSSRLFTAFLGSHIAKKNRCRLFLDIRDIFTETMESVLKGPAKKIALPILQHIERLTIKRANAINFVSEGFKGYFEKKIPENCTISYVSNGIDTCFEKVIYSNQKVNTIKKVVYAGNIGEGQGLEKIIPDLAKGTQGQCEFLIIGSGGKLNALTEKCKELHNVSILEPVPREQLIQYYQEADILFLHLNDYPAFTRVLPSKIFEYGATGKPILAGVPGYSKGFMEKYLPDVALFEPCDSLEAIKQLKNLLLKDDSYNTRKEFYENFNREKLMDLLAKKITDSLTT